MLKTSHGKFLLLIFSTITAVILWLGYVQYKDETELQYLRKEKELLSIATQLNDRLTSYDELLALQVGFERNPDGQTALLSDALRPIILDLSPKYPHTAMGYYSIKLNRNVAVGPQFQPSYLREVSRQSIEQVYTDLYLTVKNDTSVLWDGKPIFAVHLPIYRNGVIIGHTFANTTLETMDALVFNGTINRIKYLFIIWLLIVLMIYLAFYKLGQARNQLISSILQDLDISTMDKYPKLLPVLETVKKLRHDRETLIENCSSVIVRYDRAYRLQFYNSELERRLGKGAVELGKRPTEFARFPQETARRIEKAIQKVIETKSVFVEEFTSYGLTSETVNTRYLRFVWSPEFDQTREVKSVLGVSHDVTELRELQLTIQHQKEHLESMLNNISDCFYALDADMRFTFCNEDAKKHFGYDPTGMCFIEHIAKQHSPEILTNYMEVVCKKKPLCFETVSALTGRWVSVHLYPSATGGLSVLFRDIHEMKQAHEELRQTRKRFLTAFNLNPNMMSLLSLKDERYIDVNDAVLKASGLMREDIIGRTVEQFNLLKDVSILKELRRIIMETGRLSNYEVEFYSSGTLHTGLLSAETLELNGETHLLTVINDITAKKVLDKELARLDSLNLVGQIAASIGHEVRNPMTTIRGYLQMFLSKPEFNQHRDRLNTMIDELDRANAIITEFLSLAKNKSTDMRSGNLNTIINNLYPLIQADAFRLGHSVQLMTKPLSDFVMDEKSIRQIVLNLVRNALEAMDSEGTVTIKTYETRSHIVLQISDTGKGIPPEVLDKLGTPFTTTKEQGTGLGLPVVFRVAHDHNARVDVSTSDFGTDFFIRFPHNSLIQTQ